ncbi:aldehyde dehydrogenase family protein [Microbulbifer bruguierae]|uniref:Aldehyde dehydrogenase family protein n=1 Tax=Microbulbifer bruguierae TaxID=3029061 RepID=A0ABY8NFI8_9GAMM|nr:aldehyde dehydrogenase family protein [Microbulbifer bruguierae]WGL17195.1 aldehyde dehydrogenase family protein [Microbulbifer bruguierae]
MTLATSHLWIGGRDVPANDRFVVCSPIDRLPIAEVASANDQDALVAIESAIAAQRLWCTEQPATRAAILTRWAESIDAAAPQLAAMLHRESGKVMREALSEVGHGADMLRWYGQRATCITGEAFAGPDGLRLMTSKQAVGVVACITPWNFPVASVLVKVGAALAAGCACVVKPSELTPLTALALAQLSADAGLPGGLLNVLPSAEPERIAGAFCGHTGVRKLSFTGSTATGKKLYRQCADSVKRLSLELGGNAPFIVFDDADLDLALRCVVNARYYNTGQICVGANRIFVHAALHDRFAEALVKMVAGLRFGSDGDLGPLIQGSALERVTGICEDAVSKGARILCGGEPSDRGDFYFRPGVMIDMDDRMRACREEIFGPLACIYRFEDEAEVMHKANDTESGLAAYAFSRNRARLMRCADGLEAGAIGLNSSALFHRNLPFGGIKQSGLGKEQGIHCLDEFLVEKSLVIGEAS